MKQRTCFVFLFLFLCGFASAQMRQVSGKVTKEDGAPLIGVTVTLKGSNISTATDTKGEYHLQVPDRTNLTLVFSSVGFAVQERNLGANSTLDVSMKEEASNLNDVVVIGYQSVRRKDVLASVSSIGAKDLKDIPINNVAEALNGRLAGVTATTSEGSPDANIRVRIRGGMSITGSNDPLYIIDGVQVENGLSSVSPQDIQNIDVLKDAAATAIYGARGANGVIIITTKSGKPGRLLVSYNGFIGVRKLPKELEVLSPYDYVINLAERSRGSSVDSIAFAQNYGSTWDTLNVYKDVTQVDWQKEVFGQTGLTQTHNVTASGGSQKITYSFGYTRNDDKAIVLNSSYIRNLINLKADYKVTDNLKFGASGRYTHQHVYGAGVSADNGSSSLSRLRKCNTIPTMDIKRAGY
jgi:TonB-linked SusC/RagA family outer membrane protein